MVTVSIPKLAYSRGAPAPVPISPNYVNEQAAGDAAQTISYGTPAPQIKPVYQDVTPLSAPSPVRSFKSLNAHVDPLWTMDPENSCHEFIENVQHHPRGWLARLASYFDGNPLKRKRQQLALALAANKTAQVSEYDGVLVSPNPAHNELVDAGIGGAIGLVGGPIGVIVGALIGDEVGRAENHNYESPEKLKGHRLERQHRLACIDSYEAQNQFVPVNSSMAMTDSSQNPKIYEGNAYRHPQAPAASATSDQSRVDQAGNSMMTPEEVSNLVSSD